VQITSLNDIIQGELLNSPAISFIYNVKTNVNKIQEGDLFFALKHDDIELAIANGAFAIVVENNISILDNEIAWIQVENIHKAIVKYIRYKLSSFELKAYYCDTISYELLKVFSSNVTQQPFWLISSNLSATLNHLNEIKNNDVIVCNNQELLNSIYPANEDFNTSTYSIENLIEHSLFETSFSYQAYYFYRLKISSLFINQLLTVFNFLHLLPTDLHKLKKFNCFKPIFIDKFFNACEYGKSDKFVLIQEKKELALNELEYIQRKYKYAKTIIISKEAINIAPFMYTQISHVEDIFDVLNNTSFNAIYIIGFKKQKIEELFKNNNTTNALL
jgi:ferrochelatase